jgi:hypothetical protein
MGNRLGVANSLNNLGAVAREQGDYPSARAHYEESLGIRREIGDRQSIAVSHEAFATLAFKERSRERAARL